MGKFKNFLMAGAFAGLMAFLPSCEKEPSENDSIYKLPKFENIHETLIKDKLNLPSGLSNNDNSRKYGLKSTKGTLADANGIFMQAPLFINNRGAKGIEPYQNPAISEFSGNLENLSTTPLAEIDLIKYPLDFDSPVYYPRNDSLWRAKGITLDGLVLNDGTILSSSNSSDKIFKRNVSGEMEIFLQNNELERITDMIQGSDGKIYAVQAPLIDNNDSSIIIYPKRVISIENGVIKTEFELPSNVNTHFWYFNVGHDEFWWREAPIVEKLKIIENSENGKKQFGSEFYVSDLLEDVIYRVDSEKKVSELARGLKFPSSIVIDSIGNIFYTTSPLSNGSQGWDILNHKSQLCVLNPETGESKSLLQFNENVSDYASTGGWVYMKYDGQRYLMPIGHNFTNILQESTGKLEFLFTNSLQGTLKYVTLDKVLEK